MNKEEFMEITAEVITETTNHMSEKVSSDTLLAASLIMIMYSHELADKLFESKDSIEIEADNS